MTYPLPIVLNSIEAERGLTLLREIAGQAVPGEPGFARYYATDSVRFIRMVRQALADLGQPEREAVHAFSTINQ